MQKGWKRFVQSKSLKNCERYGILALRVGVMVFLILNFHWLNEHPFQVDPINLTELLYLLSIVVLFICTKKQKLPIKSRWPKLVFDFFFATFFVGLSLNNTGPHSGLYVLYLIPIIYCSYWFGKVATVSFVTAVSIIYCLSNYFMLGMNTEFKSVKEVVKVLGPMVVIFYVVAFSVIYYKRKIQTSYNDIDKKVAERTAELKHEKDYIRSLLKSSFDAIIAVDESGKVKEANEQACELLGYELINIVTKGVTDFYPRGEAEIVMKELRDSNDGAIENFHALIKNKNGENIPILLSASLLYDKELDFKKELAKGRKFPTVGYFRDKRVEEVIDIISKDITSITEEKRLLDKIAQTVAETLHAEACGILIHNENNGSLDLISSYGLPVALSRLKKRETYHNENDGMTAKVFFLNKTLNIPDIDVNLKKPDYLNVRYARNFEKNSRYGTYKHFLGVPLVVQGEVYGVIRVLNKYSIDKELDKQGFTYNDQRVLERISSQVSLLVEKVRGKGRFNAILKVGQELNQKLEISLDELLEKIAKEVVEGMRFKACYLRLIENGDKLKIKACFGLNGDYKNNSQYIIPIGHGICGGVAKTGEYLAIEDLEKEANFEFKDLIKSEGLKAMLSIPMKYRGRVIGVINCYTCRIHKFTEQEIQIMKTFAAYASIAIQNKKRIDELIALNEIGRELVKPIQTEELFDLILGKAKVLSGADRLCIKRYDERSGLLKSERASNCRWFEKCSEHPIDVRNGLGAEVLGEVIDKSQLLIIPDFSTIWEKIKDVPQKKLFQAVKSCAIIPITIDKRVYGVLFLDSYRHDFFAKDDLLVLESFSNQAAIAIRNANLFDKLKKVTETFPNISALSIDIDKVLQNIVEIAKDVLDTDILLLYRWDASHERIIWPPVYTGTINELEYMLQEVGSSDTPMSFINKKTSHYTVDSQKDPIMTSQGKPLKEGFTRRFVFREGIISSAGIILKVGQEIVGVMFINYRTHHDFDEDEQKIIENYASYIAIAIKNILHFQAKEDAMKMAIRAEKLAALGEAAGFVAHNARSDLGAVQIYTNQLIKNLAKKEITDYDDILNRIDRNLINLNTALTDLLDISKEPQIHKRFITFNNAFKEKFRDLMSEASSYKLKFSIEVADDLPLLLVDERKINQVFSNLFKNSVDATPKGGSIKVQFITDNHQILIFWENSGNSIKEEDQDKIFDAFFSTKKSWGFGLAYCKKIIEGHNGKIYVDPGFKEGCRFVIELPY
jgi:PAS domain S-box-containing protein